MHESTLPMLMMSAFLVGLLGGVHCLGMCAGVVSTLTLGLEPGIRRDAWRLLPWQLAYNLGRLGGYALAGALAGGVGLALLQMPSLQSMQRVLYMLAGVAMVVMGLALGEWWRGSIPGEGLGRALWQRLEPLGRRLLPVRSFVQAVAIGALWAWLPCGLVYTVLISAVASGGIWQGALVMLAFGAGTLPALLGMGLLAGLAARLIERRWVRRVAGAGVIGFGLWTLWQLR